MEAISERRSEKKGKKCERFKVYVFVLLLSGGLPLGSVVGGRERRSWWQREGCVPYMSGWFEVVVGCEVGGLREQPQRH